MLTLRTVVNLVWSKVTNSTIFISTRLIKSLEVGYFANFSSYCASWVKACINAGIPASRDFNTPAGTLGAGRVSVTNTSPSQVAHIACRLVGQFDRYICSISLCIPVTYISPQRRRVSSEAAYLTPDVLQRPNLHVAIGAKATRVIFSEDRAVGAEFVNKNGKRFRVAAKKEVLLWYALKCRSCNPVTNAGQRRSGTHTSCLSNFLI
jgi:choline dehydrogenase